MPSSAALRRAVTLLALIASVCCVAVSARAQAQQAAPELRLPHMLSDHAVLQRDRPIHIWGWDAPSTSITIDFRKQHVTVKADDLGAWSAYLTPEPAGGPDTLTIHGTHRHRTPRHPRRRRLVRLRSVQHGDTSPRLPRLRRHQERRPAHRRREPAPDLRSDSPPALREEIQRLSTQRSARLMDRVQLRHSHRVLRRRLPLRPRHSSTRAHPNRPRRLDMGRHTHQLMAQPGRARSRQLLHARLRRARPLRRRANRPHHPHKPTSSAPSPQPKPPTSPHPNSTGTPIRHPGSRPSSSTA